MKNTKKGFLPVILIVVAAIVLVGGGVYIYSNNKQVSVRSYDGVYLKKSAAIRVVQIDKNKIKITGNATWQGPDASKGQVNSGVLDGIVALVGNKGTYSNDVCEVEIVFHADKLIAKDNNKCGGLNVSFTGEYTKDIHAQESPVATSPLKTNTNISLSVSGNTLSVLNNGKVIQTLTPTEDGILALGFGLKAFITDKDVNFDGNNDIGVLSGTGYGGVNSFYDFYIFNPKTNLFEKSSFLSGISLGKIDPVKKQIISSEKSGPGYVTIIYQWNGSGYTRVSQ